MEISGFRFENLNKGRKIAAKKKCFWADVSYATIHIDQEILCGIFAEKNRKIQSPYDPFNTFKVSSHLRLKFMCKGMCFFSQQVIFVHSDQLKKDKS